MKKLKLTVLKVKNDVDNSVENVDKMGIFRKQDDTNVNMVCNQVSHIGAKKVQKTQEMLENLQNYCYDTNIHKKCTF